MLRVAEVGPVTVSAVLLVNSLLPEPRLWVPRLVDHDEIPAAGALDMFRGEFAFVVGPAIAGVLNAAFGLPLLYGLDVATFFASLVAISLMRSMPPPEGAEPPSLRRIAEAFRYARS